MDMKQTGGNLGHRPGWDGAEAAVSKQQKCWCSTGGQESESLTRVS